MHSDYRAADRACAWWEKHSTYTQLAREAAQDGDKKEAEPPDSVRGGCCEGVRHPGQSAIRRPLIGSPDAHRVTVPEQVTCGHSLARVVRGLSMRRTTWISHAVTPSRIPEPVYWAIWDIEVDDALEMSEQTEV